MDEREDRVTWRTRGQQIADLIRERDDLKETMRAYSHVLDKQGDLLTRTVNVLKGNPPELTLWSHHDIPELAAEAVAVAARLRRSLMMAHRERYALRAAVLALANKWDVEDGEGYAAGDNPDPFERTEQLRLLLKQPKVKKVKVE